MNLPLIPPGHLAKVSLTLMSRSTSLRTISSFFLRWIPTSFRFLNFSISCSYLRSFLGFFFSSSLSSLSSSLTNLQISLDSTFLSEISLGMGKSAFVIASFDIFSMFFQSIFSVLLLVISPKSRDLTFSLSR